MTSVLDHQRDAIVHSQKFGNVATNYHLSYPGPTPVWPREILENLAIKINFLCNQNKFSVINPCQKTQCYR